jgi:pyruvate/2-oxoglutarate dehydrogenase complex dihydrolipoamide acyltransferase (E2) component
MITVSDVEKALVLRQPLRPQMAASDLGEPRPGLITEEQATTSLPLQGFRRAMAQRMTASHQAIVQGTTVVDVDMTETVRLRERVPVSLTAFVIKAAAQAALEFPLVNASLEEDAIVLKKQVDMGVAVATEEGLLVPVVRRAETQSLTQIHRELEELAQRARDRALTAEELSNPSMTVTNSGVFGSLLFLPIVVLPQSVTLGMGKVASTPVVRAGQIVARDIMYLSLGYDHRFLDGAIAVRYLQRVKGFLEEPTLLV